MGTIATPTAIDKPKKFVKIRSVVVAHNRFESRLLMRIALGDS